MNAGADAKSAPAFILSHSMDVVQALDEPALPVIKVRPAAELQRFRDAITFQLPRGLESPDPVST